MKRIFLTSAFVFMCATAHAEITIHAPWVRATVPQQQYTGAFMRITSSTDVRLVAAQSPAAEHLEIHEMKMEGDVMKMRQIDGLNIPAGQSVELRPGGYHIMFIGLKQQAKEGDEVAVKLVFEGKGHANEIVNIKAMVRPLNASSEKPMPMGAH